MAHSKSHAVASAHLKSQYATRLTRLSVAFCATPGSVALLAFCAALGSAALLVFCGFLFGSVFQSVLSDSMVYFNLILTLTALL